MNVSLGEQLYKLDRLIAKAIGGRPFDTLSAMAARGEAINAEGWEFIAHVLDAISPIEREQIVLEFKDGLSPGVIRSVEDEGYCCVIMPMRI